MITYGVLGVRFNDETKKFERHWVRDGDGNHAEYHSQEEAREVAQKLTVEAREQGVKNYGYRAKIFDKEAHS